MDAVKSILPTLVLDSVAPMVDQASDLALIIEWYSTEHFKFAAAMAIPFLMNVFSNIYHWWKWDSTNEKKYTWILLLLQLWPIYRAFKLVSNTYKKNPNAKKEKLKFEREIVSLEPFLEAVPSLIVMMFALHTTKSGCKSCEKNEDAVIGDSPTLFWATFIISLLTSTLGVCKYLLNGPCSLIPKYGYLDGMFTCNFLLAYLAVLFTLSAKAIVASLFFDTDNMIYSSVCEQDSWNPLIQYENKTSNETTQLEIIAPRSSFRSLLASFGLVFLPQLILSVSSILYATGCNKTFFKTVAQYPQLVLISIFTHFTVGSRSILSCSSEEKEGKRRQLGVSKPLTMVNGIITLIFYALGTCFSVSNRCGEIGEFNQRIAALVGLITYLGLPGVFFTFLFFSYCSSCFEELDTNYIDFNNKSHSIQINDSFPRNNASKHQEKFQQAILASTLKKVRKNLQYTLCQNQNFT